MAQYEMNLDLNVLNHLGINLYTKIPAVLSETVANAYDADASEVFLEITESKVIIRDNGCGMSRDDVNRKFLTVGYEKRLDLLETPIFHRKPMGKKGIGKLSLFSIANVIEVQTYNGITKDAFIINVDELREFISNKNNSREHKAYEPKPITPTIESKGTIITLTELRKNRTLKAPEKIKTELARRFDVFNKDFTVYVNGEPISFEDRKYFEYVKKLYIYGECKFDIGAVCKKLDYGYEKRNNKITETETVNGWIGFVDSPESLKVSGEDDNVNKIFLFCRGKMGQEDILSSIKNSSNYNQYLVGVINADFFDRDDEQKTDMATTSRENFNQESEEYKSLKEFIKEEIKYIGNDWNKIKGQEGVKKAIEIEPEIKTWFDELKGDEKTTAEKVLGNINKIITKEEDRKELTKYGIMAFEKLRYTKSLSLIEEIDAESYTSIGKILGGIDDLEAGLYYQIVKGRLDVLNKFRDIVSKDADSLEKVIQEYLFKHMWLLDPSWERPTSNEKMESSFRKLFDENTTLTKEELDARVDICFKNFAGKLVVVELKRANRQLSIGELVQQINKYSGAIKKCLQLQHLSEQNYEIIVVLGKFVDGDSSPSHTEDVARSINTFNARIVYYQELIHGALNAYKSYYDQHDKLNALINLFRKLDGTKD